MVAADPPGSAPSPVRRAVPVRVWLPVGLAVALLAGFAAWALSGSRAPVGSSSSEGLPTLATGRAAPDFDLARLGGGAPVDLAADRGTPVVVNFFASWCRNCRGELRAFAAVWRATGGRVDFVGVDTSETDPAEAQDLLARAGADYPVGLDSRGVTAGDYSVVGLPTTVFVSRSGAVAGEAFGPESAGALERWVGRLERAGSPAT